MLYISYTPLSQKIEAQAEGEWRESAQSAEARFLVKYSSAWARFFVTDGFTHFFRPGSMVSEQPAASIFSFADAEKARALKSSFTLKSPHHLRSDTRVIWEANMEVQWFLKVQPAEFLVEYIIEMMEVQLFF